VHSEVLKNALFARLRVLIFHQFFSGGVSRRNLRPYVQTPMMDERMSRKRRRPRQLQQLSGARPLRTAADTAAAAAKTHGASQGRD